METHWKVPFLEDIKVSEGNTSYVVKKGNTRKVDPEITFIGRKDGGDMVVKESSARPNLHAIVNDGRGSPDPTQMKTFRPSESGFTIQVRNMPPEIQRDTPPNQDRLEETGPASSTAYIRPESKGVGIIFEPAVAPKFRVTPTSQ
ncbi:hypothetical protein HY407_05175 [Candidatus Gottesmanbacteria bacterium]|nr:hypothetical protein [Candidatus Gottesmanbacteria bacterium]